MSKANLGTRTILEMSGQRFYADPRHSFEWPNGAIGYRPTARGYDSLGPYAKVKYCPIVGTFLRRTCYATGQASDAFSIPAVCKVDGMIVRGYFTSESDGFNYDEGVVFVPLMSEHGILNNYLAEYQAAQVVEKGI